MGEERQIEIERLFRQYGKGIGGYVLARIGDAELAEEITARVFLTVVRQIEQRRGHEAGWLWAIARSELARYFRDRSARAPLEADLPAADEPPAEQAARREQFDRLRAALDRLAEPAREVVGMKFFLGLRNHEIAAATGLSVSNVGVIVHRALKELRRLLGDPFAGELSGPKIDEPGETP